MVRAMISSLVLILLHASIASAIILEVPLPALHGTYPVSPTNAERTTSIVLPQAPSAIHGASFRLSGTTVQGEIYCSDEDVFLPFPMDLSARMRSEGPLSFWFAGDPDAMRVNGPFGWTAAFAASSQSATWSFLLDGVADISLHGGSPGTWCYPLSYPSAVVTEAVLILDADFPVATRATTWGHIKALYR